MDILIKTKRLLFLAFVLIVISQISARSSTDVGPDSDLQKAFKESYAFEVKGEYGSAIEVLKKVYDEKVYEINLRLGWLYYANKQYDESISYYEKAISLMPSSIEAKFGLVYPLTAQEKWEKVYAQYTAILVLDPNNSKANYYTGLGYYYRADYQNAYKYFEKIVTLYPFDGDSELMFAWTNFQLGKSKEAEMLFRKVLLISPDNSSALEGLALLNKK
jgi:tetratricopeptide (TPR) repeat protein